MLPSLTFICPVPHCPHTVKISLYSHWIKRGYGVLHSRVWLDKKSLYFLSSNYYNIVSLISYIRKCTIKCIFKITHVETLHGQFGEAWPTGKEYVVIKLNLICCHLGAYKPCEFGKCEPVREKSSSLWTNRIPVIKFTDMAKLGANPRPKADAWWGSLAGKLSASFLGAWHRCLETQGRCLAHLYPLVMACFPSLDTSTPLGHFFPCPRQADQVCVWGRDTEPSFIRGAKTISS